MLALEYEVIHYAEDIGGALPDLRGKHEKYSLHVTPLLSANAELNTVIAKGKVRKCIQARTII